MVKKKAEHDPPAHTPDKVVHIVSCGHCGTKHKAVADLLKHQCPACTVTGKWEKVD